MGKKKATKKAGTGEATSPQAPAQAVAGESAPAEKASEGQQEEGAEELTYSGMRPRGGKWKNARCVDGVTLAELADRYVRALEEHGKSLGTVLSYRVELVTALNHLGRETPARELTTERVVEYFACDKVNLTRSGTAKARVSVLKTQRVLRQALTWAQQAGLLEVAPLPGPETAPQPAAA